MNFRIHSFLLIVLLVIIPGYFLMGQSAPTDAIISCIRKADASCLAKNFSSTIDLELGNTDGNYSKKQAEIIVKDFFDKNPVQSFAVNHNGSSNDGSKYVIGSCISKNSKKFRVYILLKKQNEQLMITQMQFEED